MAILLVSRMRGVAFICGAMYCYAVGRSWGSVNCYILNCVWRYGVVAGNAERILYIYYR